MRFLKTYRIPFLLIIGLYFFHLFAKDYSSKYEKPIVGDAQAYYAYLPAIFIYHDLSYEFLAEINQKYYTESNTKSFLNQVGDQKVNKTFPGVAVLYAPFFFLAHAIALATNLEADGYSFIYQFCFDLALWFYLLVGLIAMQQILRRLNLKNHIVELSTTFIVLATNIFFYSFYDQSVTHIYNFFLINSLVLLCLNQYRNPTKKRLVLKGSHLALSFQARARTNIKNSRLVYEYNTTYGTSYLDTYLKKDNWIPIDVLIEPNQPIKTPLKFYFWNGNTAEKIEIKQLKFTHYFSDGYF